VATVPSIGRAVSQTAGIAAQPAEATRDLYERYGRQMFAYCLVQLRNREDAEDAVQTTFLNAFRGLERGVVPELESAWLYKIAQHVCLTRRRSWSRRRNVESPEDFNTVGSDGSPMRNTDDFYELTDALRTLPEQQRRAILLREWQGLTYKEIAAEMQLSQAAVETLIFRARRSLVQAIERLRASGDMGSIFAALKSLLFGVGTKVAVTSYVATTPSSRRRRRAVRTSSTSSTPSRTSRRPRRNRRIPTAPRSFRCIPSLRLLRPRRRGSSQRPSAPRPVSGTRLQRGSG
jgi:RNA polymerase sigma factor (sigma-70 family)